MDLEQMGVCQTVGRVNIQDTSVLSLAPLVGAMNINKGDGFTLVEI
jgi:hypothetical protein